MISRGRAAPVVVQAESGTLGTSFSSAVSSGVGFVTVTGTSAGSNPGSAARVITYSVTLPATGVYELYARMRVGAGAGNDDSFFYAASFGVKSSTTNADWITVNNLSTAGFTAAGDTVVGSGTVSATGVWKWVRLSSFNGGTAPVQFLLSSGSSLTQTFQIGGREDGLDLDRFVFAAAGTTFTVGDLDNGLAGTVPAAFAPTGPPAATGKPKFVGSVHGTVSVSNFTHYWNQVTPENAGKWGKRRVRVRALGVGPERLRLTVEDDGPGLPPERREEVVRRGARLDENAPGSGLGLSIIDELARAYRGSLSLGISSLGGLAVQIDLPRAEA